MDRKDADTFMKTKENRDQWIMEATGYMGELDDKPYKSKYINGMLYVWWFKDDDEGEVYDVTNIYGESEYGFDVKDYDDLEILNNKKIKFINTYSYNKGGEIDMTDDEILLGIRGISRITNAIKGLTRKTDERLLDIANQINNLDKSYLTVDMANSLKDIADSLKKLENK